MMPFQMLRTLSFLFVYKNQSDTGWQNRFSQELLEFSALLALRSSEETQAAFKAIDLRTNFLLGYQDKDNRDLVPINCTPRSIAFDGDDAGKS
jgi:hypothetical protein